MAYLMTGGEYAQKALDIAYNYLTAYANGTYGQPKSDSLIDSCASRLKWYTAENIATLKALSSSYYLFDCSGLVKGIGWGFPNVVYGSNDVPDHNDAGFWNDCGNTQSTDWTNIEVGELLHMNGHVGIYIGDGKGVECTPGFGGLTPGLKITAVGNIGKINGFPTRTWTGHGKLPWIEYVNSSAPSSPTPVEPYTPNPTPPMPSVPTVTDELTKFSVKIFPSSYVFGDKIEGMATEWDSTKTEQENIYKFLEYVNPNIRYKLKDEFDDIVDWFHYVASRSYGLTDSEWSYYYISDKGVAFNIGDYVSDVYFDLETSKWSPPMTYDATYWYSLFLCYGNGRFCSPINWSYNPALVYNKESNIIPIRSYSEHSSGYTDNPDDVSTYLVAFWKREGNTIVYDKLYVLYNVTDPNAGLYKAWQYILLTDDLTNFDISYEPFSPTPPTPGEGDDEMEFPNSKLANIFTTQYALTMSQMNAIGNFLSNGTDPTEGQDDNFMTKLLEDMGYMTGIATDAIIDLTIYPFDVHLYNQCKTVNRLKLGFGSDFYKQTGGTKRLNKGVLYLWGENQFFYEIEMLNPNDSEHRYGKIRFDWTEFNSLINRTFDFRDYPPFKTYEIYIPFIGIVNIDQRKFFDKYFRVEYIVDYFTGTANALLELADNDSGLNTRIIETFDCNIGVHESVNSVDWASYASRVGTVRRQATLGSMLNVFSGEGGFKGIGEKIGDVLQTEGTFTANQNGSFSSSSLYFMPLKIYIIQYTQETHVTGNLNSLSGGKSNTSGTIGSFTGFLQCSDVDLVCPRATESEKAQIINYLTNGIRI